MLRDNPAITWYKRNDFRKACAFEEHFKLELDMGIFEPCHLEVILGVQSHDDKGE